MTATERRNRTYLYERLRAPASGMLEAAAMTFLLLIAVRHFESGAVAKALISAGASLGLLLGPWLVSVVQNLQWTAARAAARVAMLGAALFLVAAVVRWQWIFALCSALAMACASVIIPLMTQVYHENYPERERGTLFSRTVMIRIMATLTFSYVAGRALTDRLDQYAWLMVALAAAFGFAAWCLWRCPSRPLARSEGAHPFRALRFAREDRLFRQTLISWMLLGFGNLMMVPLRVEYLANPVHGISTEEAVMTAGTVALLTGVIPNAARLVLNPLWGWLFDRMNFFVLRMTLNLGFLIGILTFFLSGSMTGLVLGAVCYGVAHSGGDVAWSLWVTKFAPADRVADYMSVHTFFTGLRGVVAPAVAFSLITVVPVGAMAAVSAGLILIGTLLLLPEIRFGKGRPHAAALTEDVSD